MSIDYQVATGQEQFAPALKALAKTFAKSGETIYKARNEIKRMHWHGVPVIVKSFAVPGYLRGLIYGQLRQSKAQRAYQNALELECRGVSTPTPIGFIEDRQAGALRQSFYASSEWTACVTLRAPLFDSQFPDRTEILQAFGRFAFELHKKQVHHRDFSPGNILITTTSSAIETSGNWGFCLVDVNRMRFESLSLKKRMQNFVMLWASDEDLEIIVKAYSRVSGDHLQTALALALEYSNRHKYSANRKERIKTILGLH